MTNDITSLRDLARRYADLAARPEMDERRDLWRRHNSLKHTRPPIYVRAFAWHEMPEVEMRVRGPAAARHRDAAQGNRCVQHPRGVELSRGGRERKGGD